MKITAMSENTQLVISKPYYYYMKFKINTSELSDNDKQTLYNAIFEYYDTLEKAFDNYIPKKRTTSPENTYNSIWDAATGVLGCFEVKKFKTHLS
jgi:hypothetical protein